MSQWRPWRDNQFSEITKTIQDKKVEFNEEIETVINSQLEIKLKMKTLLTQAKRSIVNCSKRLKDMEEV